MAGNVLVFDTCDYVRKLRDAGVPELQAAIQAEAMVGLIEERLATRREIEEVKADLQRDIEALGIKITQQRETIRAELKRDIEAAKTESIRWMAGMFVAQTALILGVLIGMSRMQPPQPVTFPAAPQVMTAPQPMPPALPPTGR